MMEIVVVFDFNKTIIDLDSDNWVVDEFVATDLFNQLVPTMLWNTVMDTMIKEIHVRGKTIHDTEEVMKRAHVISGVVPTIKVAHVLGCDLRIVQNANLFFVETILKHSEIKDCFSKINTNPSYIDDEGKLRIRPYHNFDHKCNNPCPPNVCKVLVIERMQASLALEGNKKRMIYLGDRAGNFFPNLMLKEQDFVMPRKDFSVWKLMNENHQLIKAEIHEWTDGEEFEHILLHIIKAITTIEEKQILSIVDYSKFQMIPIGSAGNEKILGSCLRPPFMEGPIFYHFLC
ncbi:Inorganic pyrophosphatase 1, partial [Capsicum annuum]|uniref:inorganic pyrophosphatase 1-like n=1 Tax=Capsicum annuum TaxID=4072 RepID=UPI0007BEF6E9